MRIFSVKWRFVNITVTAAAVAFYLLRWHYKIDTSLHKLIRPQSFILVDTQNKRKMNKSFLLWKLLQYLRSSLAYWTKTEGLIFPITSLARTAKERLSISRVSPPVVSAWRVDALSVHFVFYDAQAPCRCSTWVTQDKCSSISLTFRGRMYYTRPRFEFRTEVTSSEIKQSINIE